MSSCYNFVFNKENCAFRVKGKLKAGEYRVSGNLSSQFITGLLFAFSTLDEDSRIHITTKIESLSYVNLTISAMAEFGVNVVWEDDATLYIKGGQSYTANNITVEGD